MQNDQPSPASMNHVELSNLIGREIMTQEPQINIRAAGAAGSDIARAIMRLCVDKPWHDYPTDFRVQKGKIVASLISIQNALDIAFPDAAPEEHV